MKQLFFILPFFLILYSCSKQKTISDSEQPVDSLHVLYAEGFSIKYYPDYKKVTVFSPWLKGEVYAQYFLVNNNSVKTPLGGTKIVIPLNSLAATSVTHFEFLSLLGELETVSAVCSPDIIYNNEINKNFKTGKITDLGNAFNINVEKTLHLHPDAVMMSGYNQNDPYAQRVSQAGIPVIFNNEWIETSLLARAEWIKFIAAFYNKEKVADSIFFGIDERYNEIKLKASEVKFKPKIMAGSNFRGTWYVPSGNSFMGKLFADAGATYIFAKDTTAGSIPLNVETALKYFSDADIWLNCNFKSIQDLVKADAKHALFKPVKTNQVYNFNKRLLPSTANDFWESAVARPDLLLSDVISIIHPELMPDYQTVYAEKLGQQTTDDKQQNKKGN